MLGYSFFCFVSAGVGSPDTSGGMWRYWVLCPCCCCSDFSLCSGVELTINGEFGGRLMLAFFLFITKALYEGTV